MYSVSERIHIAWKWLLSFRRRDWTLADYPFRARHDPGGPPSALWVAQILNWIGGPTGIGATRDEAFKDLRANFADTLKWRRERNESTPRPGILEAPRFASFTRVNADPALLDRFIQNVLGIAPGDPVFISDESSLLHFVDEPEVERLHGLIRSNFGIDVSDLQAGNIADILERIAAYEARSAGTK